MSLIAKQQQDNILNFCPSDFAKNDVLFMKMPTVPVVVLSYFLNFITDVLTNPMYIVDPQKYFF